MERFLGQTLKGRYQINEIIGIGGMAVVYKAFDLVLARDVAVKILKDEYMRDEEFRRRFSNESKAITLLSDKNIVDIYDVRMDGEVLFIAMEYLDGVTLKEYIDNVGALNWREAVHYIKQILSAVQHAHERGVVHRDIKPQNIMLLRDGTVKMMDFGIARVSDYETHSMSAEAIGSVHYISPEQASGDVLDERTDIYSIGILLYQLCTGSLPFDDENAVTVALMQIQEQPILPREHSTEIPVGLEQIILHAMMKDPLERYVEASDMLMDIETIEENPAYVFRDENYEDLPNPTPTFTDSDASAEQQVVEEKPLTKEEKKKLSTIWQIIAGVASAGAFFVLILIGMFVFPDILDEPKYEVPNLIDKMFDEVVANDKYEKFNIVKKGEKASEKKKGMILSQSVPEFTMVKEGTTIEVYISSGVSMVCVPDIIGLDVSKAKDMMEDNQIPFKIIEIFSDKVAKGKVVSTSVAPGDEVDVSTDVVIIYVSKGSENEHVVVPDLANKTVEQARTELANIGLKLNETIEEEYSDSVKVGQVLRQTPASGKTVDKGSSVTVYISKGPDPSKEPETASVVVSIAFDESYVGQLLSISIKQGETILGMQEVQYESLTNGSYLWNGQAKIGETIDVLVDGAVVNTQKIVEGLNNISITMTGGSYGPPVAPNDPNNDPEQPTVPEGPTPENPTDPNQPGTQDPTNPGNSNTGDENDGDSTEEPPSKPVGPSTPGNTSFLSVPLTLV